MNKVIIWAGMASVLEILTAAPKVFSEERSINSKSVAVGGVVGTLGVGGEISYILSGTANQTFILRGNFSVLEFHLDELATSIGVVDPEDYNFSASGAFAGGLLDWHPFSRGWRLTSGFYYVDLEFKDRPSAGGSIGSNIYSEAEVGAVQTKVSNKNSFAPYIGFGYDSAAVNYEGAGLTFGIDMGALYTGEPDIKIATDRSVAGLDNDIAQEAAELKQNIDRYYGFYPVVMISGKLSF